MSLLFLVVSSLLAFADNPALTMRSVQGCLSEDLPLAEKTTLLARDLVVSAPSPQKLYILAGLSPRAFAVQVPEGARELAVVGADFMAAVREPFALAWSEGRWARATRAVVSVEAVPVPLSEVVGEIAQDLRAMFMFVVGRSTPGQPLPVVDFCYASLQVLNKNYQLKLFSSEERSKIKAVLFPGVKVY